MGVEQDPSLHEGPKPEPSSEQTNPAIPTDGIEAESEGVAFVGEQTVFDRVKALEEQVARLEAEKARQRALRNARQQRWRDSHREAVRQQDAAYRRELRARRRGEGGAAPR